jgi:hypothetical protein
LVAAQAGSIEPIDRNHEIAHLRQFGPERRLIDASDRVCHDDGAIEITTHGILDHTHAPRCFRDDRRNLPLDAVWVGVSRRIAASPRRHEANGFGSSSGCRAAQACENLIDIS